ncbi:MAG: YitT family protein, partial [Clostridia bacterium]|nr:YitT family protein [Clostridia bacterium]
SFFSGEEKSVLLCVVKKYEITKLKGIIQEIDKNAFVILSDAREVLGNGFKSH